MSSTTTTKVSISPSFKGQFTSIMRQRQLFLDAQQRASQSTPPPTTSILHRIWRSISNWVSKKVPPSKADDAKAGSILRTVLPIFITMGVGVGVGVGWGLAQQQQQQQHSSSLVATRWPYVTSIPGMVRCYCPSPLVAWTTAVFNKLVAVHSLVLMGAASTVISGTLLCMFVSLPDSMRRFRHRYSGLPGLQSDSECSESSESKATSTHAAATDADFESLFYDEYDTMMAMAASDPSNYSTPATNPTTAPSGSLSAIPVTTPRCELMITYVPARSAFGYYTDRKDAIPYTHLETAARMFLVKNARPDLARLAYVDRRKSPQPQPQPASCDTAPAPATDAALPSPVQEAAESSNSSNSSGGIFAMFKSYNRKSSSSSSSGTAAPGAKDKDKAGDGKPVEPSKVSDTHFVYLGTMQDYKNTRKAPERCGSGGSSDETPYVNIKYSEFKKNKV
jgi:hypothetical protein